MPDPELTERCDQCGREGTRGFKIVGPHGPWDRRGINYFVVCASERACRRRWPRESEDAREARLA